MAGEKRKSTQAIILEKVTSLEIAVLGHPQASADEGLMGDVKHIRRVTEATVTRVEGAETAIAAIVARCEERHNPSRADGFRQIPAKKKATFLGSLLTLSLAVLYSLGVWLGWWPPQVPPN